MIMLVEGHTSVPDCVTVTPGTGGGKGPFVTPKNYLKLGPPHSESYLYRKTPVVALI